MRLLSTAIAVICAFLAGYHYPRDLELESTKPIAFHYEVTNEAAKYLILRDLNMGRCEP